VFKNLRNLLQSINLIIFIVLSQLITPENDLYDDQVSADDLNLFFDSTDDEDD